MAGTEQVLVPDIGDFDDVPVIEVLVAVGDTVAAEDPLVVLESDKATMEVPSPAAGKVAAIEVSVGDKVKEGSAILSLEVERRQRRRARAGRRRSPSRCRPRSPRTSRRSRSRRPSRSPPPVPASPQAGTQGEAPGLRQPGRAPAGARARRRPEHGVRVRPQGPDHQGGRAEGQGRAGGGAAAAAPAGAPAGLDLAPWPKVNFEKFGEVERQPLTRIQKISGPNLARNWVMIPHVTHNDEADITELEAFRKRTNGEQSEAKVTMVALLAKAVVASLKAFPVVNSSLDGDDLVLKRYYNIGFAADTPNGLVVPVIKDADTKGILEIAQDLTALSGKAREGKLGPADMSGATFTISSLGGIGGTSFTPIVNAPEVAILGVTRSSMKPVWNGSEFVPRLMVPLSLSYDHRVIDGALAARFVAHLVGVLSDLRRVVL